MKSIYKSIFGVAAAAMTLFTACDDVKEDDRYIELPNVTAERNVVLVDFTGQNCLNCPNAHEVMEQLEEQYGDNLIAISVHCGGSSLGIDVNTTVFPINRVGLMTAFGNGLQAAYGIQSLPRGMVNMTGASMDDPEWAAAVRTALEQPNDINLSATAEFVPTDSKDPNYGQANGISGTIKINSTASSTANHPGALIQYWIIEDGIKAQQKFPPDGSINKDYIHNNVFRAMVFDEDNGNLRGQKMAMAPGEEVKASGSIDARFSNREHWMLENLRVVAFVYEGSVGILQAVNVPVTLPEGYVQPAE